MGFVKGIRGPNRERWCDCGDSHLEVIGEYLASDPDLTDPKDFVYEFSHMPKCPVCVDKIRTGELVPDDAAGESLAAVLR